MASNSRIRFYVGLCGRVVKDCINLEHINQEDGEVEQKVDHCKRGRMQLDRTRATSCTMKQE